MTFPSVNWGNKSDKKGAKQLPVLHYKSCKRSPNGRRSPFSQNSDRPLHPLVSTALAGLNNSLLSYHSVEGEKIQILWLTLQLFLDNLVNKITLAWNLKNVKLSRRKY